MTLWCVKVITVTMVLMGYDGTLLYPCPVPKDHPGYLVTDNGER